MFSVVTKNFKKSKWDEKTKNKQEGGMRWAVGIQACLNLNLAAQKWKVRVSCNTRDVRFNDFKVIWNNRWSPVGIRHYRAINQQSRGVTTTPFEPTQRSPTHLQKGCSLSMVVTQLPHGSRPQLTIREVIYNWWMDGWIEYNCVRKRQRDNRRGFFLFFFLKAKITTSKSAL